MSYPISALATTPDSGLLLQEALSDPYPSAPNAEAPSITVKEPIKKPENVLSIEIQAFRFKGSLAKIKEADLQKEVSPYIGKKVFISELQAITQKITAYLRRQGYALATAYLLPQEIKNGVVEITLVIGKLDRDRADHGIALNLYSTPRLSEERIGRTMEQALNTQTINHLDVERGLLLLNALPGLSATGTISTGEAPETFKLKINAHKTPLINGSVIVDNYGNRYVGHYKTGAALAFNSPLYSGDKLALQGAISEGSRWGQIDYSLPMGYSGLRAGFRYNTLGYRLGQEFSVLEAKGTATTQEGYLSYPFILTLKNQLIGTLKIDKKQLSDRILARETNNKRIGSVSLRIICLIHAPLKHMAIIRNWLIRFRDYKS